MKIQYLSLAALALVLLGVSPVLADNSATPPGMFRQLRQGIRQELRTTLAVIRQGKVTGKGTNSLTVSWNGTSLTVNTDANTKLFRRFGAKSSLDEISVGDTINVIGKYTDTGKTTILAQLIRDLSIQKRHGLFVGTVKSLTSGGLVLTPVKRSDQTVTFSSTTKFINRRQQIIAQSDIKVGDRIRVRGVWDSTNNTITEIVDVKDYNLPPHTVATGTPVPTPTP